MPDPAPNAADSQPDSTSGPPFSRPATVWMFATLAAGLIYVLTMAPGLAWGDSANAQTRVLLGHLVDPQDPVRSHVTYYAVASAVARLGMSPALASNFVSAIAGAVTIGNVALILSLLTRRRVCVVATTAMLTFSHVLWHQATVAEVMTFSTMLLTLEIAAVVLFVRQPTWRPLAAAFFANGLGVATHNLAGLTLPALAAMLFIARPRFAIGRGVLAWVLPAGIAWLIGLSPLLFVFVNTYDPSLGVLDALIGLLVGRFGGQVFNLTVPFVAILKLAAYGLYSFPTPLIAFGFVGCLQLFRSTSRPFFAYWVVGVLVHLLFAVRYNVVDQHAFLLHSSVFATILIGLGLDRWLAHRRSTGTAALIIILSLIAPATYAIFPEILRRHFSDTAIVPRRVVAHRDRFNWFLKPWRNGDDGPSRFAADTLTDLPPGAVLAVDSTLMFPILYVQNDHNFRTDVQIVGARGFQPWLESFITLDGGAADQFIRAGRLFTVTDDRSYVNGHLRDACYQFKPRGTVFQVTLTSNSP